MCGSQMQGALTVGFECTFANEIGHIYAHEHVWVPGDPDNDTMFPKCGSDRRSIGEAGDGLSAAS